MSHELIRQGEKLDFSFDWTSFLSTGDSVSAHSWSVSPADPTLGNISGAVVTIEGCTFGKVYRLKEVMTTVNGLKGERTISLRCI